MDPVQCSFFVGPGPWYGAYESWGESVIALTVLVGLLWSLRRGRPDVWTVVAILAAGCYLAAASAAPVVDMVISWHPSCRTAIWIVGHTRWFEPARIASVATLLVALLLRRRPRRAGPVVIDSGGAVADAR